MKFSGLTKKGRLYLAKIQAAEEPIQFTKIKFGDGKLSEHENPADLVDIKNIKVEKSILNKEQKEDAVILTTIIDNVGLVEGYFPRETGIYVQDEDQEVLYFYMNDGDETSWLPPEVDGPHKMEMKINLISSNTGSVLVHNDGKDLYITKDYLESNYTQKGNFNGTAQDIEDRVVAAVGKEDGKFPLTESVAGNIYYFPGNKKFYYCLKSQTSRVSVPNADFEELSIYQNRKKLENLSKTKINITENVPKNLLELNALANTLLKFSNQDSFSGLKNFEILAKNGTFFMRISKTPSFYIFEIFLQVSKYFVGTWYRDSELIFVQIS
ncbi:phage tail protein [Fusobacterium nucleatum]|uniref:phage tail-collar fiber domain-containing protein n=1 Tax=Fusobacterium nucleatum TaxID=851 RepID=UPI00235E262D|nr:phage tail protein [Fusobacterium nucleatum]WDD89778.1 phage tail protein [Fusobacterium nucleatum]